MTFSMKWLFVVIAYIAISVAALLNANSVWHHSLHSSTVLLVLLALVAAVWSLGERRAFWGGCFLWGVVYFGWFAGYVRFEGSNTLVPSKVWWSIHSRMFTARSETLPMDDIKNLTEVDVEFAVPSKGGTVSVMIVRPRKLTLLRSLTHCFASR